MMAAYLLNGKICRYVDERCEQFLSIVACRFFFSFITDNLFGIDTFLITMLTASCPASHNFKWLTICSDGTYSSCLEATYFHKKLPPDFSDETVMAEGIAVQEDAGKLSALFIKAAAQHRFWDREKPKKVPA